MHTQGGRQLKNTLENRVKSGSSMIPGLKRISTLHGTMGLSLKKRVDRTSSCELQRWTQQAEREPQVVTNTEQVHDAFSCYIFHW